MHYVHVSDIRATVLEETRENMTMYNLEAKESELITPSDVLRMMTGQWMDMDFTHLLNPETAPVNPKRKLKNNKPKKINKGMWAIYAIKDWTEYREFITKFEHLVRMTAPSMWNRDFKSFLQNDCGMVYKRGVTEPIAADCIFELFYELETQSAKAARKATPSPTIKAVMAATEVKRSVVEMGIMAAALAAQNMVHTSKSAPVVARKASPKQKNPKKKPTKPNTSQPTHSQPAVKSPKAPQSPSCHEAPAGFNPKWRTSNGGKDATLLRSAYAKLGKCFHYFVDNRCNQKIDAKHGGDGNCCRNRVSHTPIEGPKPGSDASAYLIEKHQKFISTKPKGGSHPEGLKTGTTTLPLDTKVLSMEEHTVTNKVTNTHETEQAILPVQVTERTDDVRNINEHALTEADDEEAPLPTFSTKRCRAADHAEAMSTPYPRPNQPEVTQKRDTIKAFVFNNFVCSVAAMQALSFDEAMKIGFPRDLGSLIPQETLHATDNWIHRTFKGMDNIGRAQQRSTLHSGSGCEVYIEENEKLYMETSQHDIVWDLRKVNIDPYDIAASTTDRGFILPIQVEISPPRTLNRANIARDLADFEGQDIARQLAGLGFEEPYDAPVVLSLSPPHKGALNNIEEYDKLNDTAMQPENGFVENEAYAWLAYYPSSIQPANVLDQSTPEKDKWRDTHDESWTPQCDSAAASTSPNDRYRESEHTPVSLPRPHDMAKALRILRTMREYMPTEWSEKRKDAAIQFVVLDFSAYFKRINNHPRFWSRHQRLIRSGKENAKRTRIHVERACMFGSGYLPYLAQASSNAYIHTVKRKYKAKAPKITSEWLLRWKADRLKATHNKGGEDNDDELWLAVYIDDTLEASLMEETAPGWVPLQETLKIATQTAADWGLPLSISKQIGPTLVGVMLGVEMNLTDETMTLHKLRKARYAKAARDIAEAARVLKSEMKTVLHKLIWSAAACIPQLAALILPLFYPTRYKYKSHKGMVTMTETLQKKWHAVANMIEDSDGVAMMPSMIFPADDDPRVMVAYTDASGDEDMGMGGVCHPYYWSTQFRPHEAKLSVPVKEYMAMNIMLEIMARTRSEPYCSQYTDSDNGKSCHASSKSGHDMLARMVQHGHEIEVRTGLIRKVTHLLRHKNQESDDLSKLDIAKFKQTAAKRGYRGPLIHVRIPEDIRDTRRWFVDKAIDDPTMMDETALPEDEHTRTQKRKRKCHK